MTNSGALLLAVTDKVISYNLNTRAINWTSTFAGSQIDKIEEDPDGDHIVSGRFETTVSIGAINKSNPYPTGNGVFVASLSQLGSVNWIKTLTSPSDLGTYDFDVSDKVNDEKSVVITTTFEQEVNWEGTVTPSQGGKDVLMTGVLTSGSSISLFRQFITNPGNQTVNHVQFADSTVSIYYLTGTFDNTTDFGIDQGILTNRIMTPDGETNAYLLCMNLIPPSTTSGRFIQSSWQLKGSNEDKYLAIQSYGDYVNQRFYSISHNCSGTLITRNNNSGNSLNPGYIGLKYLVNSIDGKPNLMLTKSSFDNLAYEPLLTKAKEVHDFIITQKYILIGSEDGLEVRLPF